MGAGGLAVMSMQADPRSSVDRSGPRAGPLLSTDVGTIAALAITRNNVQLSVQRSQLSEELVI